MYDFQKYLTFKQLEMHGCVPGSVGTNVLALKQWSISIHSVDKIFIVLNQIHTKILRL